MKIIFCVNNDFIIHDNINIIQVITSYKKYVYFIKYSNNYILNDNYCIDKYYNLINNIKLNDDLYNYITNTDYYDVVLAAVIYDNYKLLFINENMENNYDIVLTVIKQNS